VDRLRSKHDFAFVLQGTGNFAQARRMLGEILPLLTEVLSENDPNTLWCKHHLALSHQYEGKYQEAEQLHLEVLAVRQRTLGEDHLDTLETKTDLGNLSKDNSQWEKAVRYHLEVWTSRDRQLGPLNYSTVVSLQNLAISLYELGDRRGALQKLQRARERMEALEGEDSRAAIMIGYNLALLQMRAGKDAEPLFREIIDKMERVFTDTHPHTWLCWSKFACYMEMKARRSQTNLAEAEHADPPTCFWWSKSVLMQIKTALLGQGVHSEAERRSPAEEAEYYFKRASAAVPRGGLMEFDYNPELQDFRAMLAGFYCEQGVLQQVQEDMLRDVVHHMDRDPGIEHLETWQERKRRMLLMLLAVGEEFMESTAPTETTSDHDNIEDLLPIPEHRKTDAVSAVCTGSIVKALGKMGPAAAAVGAVPALVYLLRDTNVDPRFRSFAAWILGEMGPAAVGAMPALVNLLQVTDVDPAVRSAVAWALAKIGTEPECVSQLPAVVAAVPALVNLFQDADLDPELGRSLPWALGELAPESTAKEILKRLRDPHLDRCARCHLAGVFGQMGPGVAGAVPQLVNLLRDAVLDREVRKSLACAVGGMRPACDSDDLSNSHWCSVSAEQLVDLLQDSNFDSELRRSLASGFTLVSVPLLLELLANPSLNQDHSLLTEALKRIGSPMLTRMDEKTAFATCMQLKHANSEVRNIVVPSLSTGHQAAMAVRAVTEQEGQCERGLDVCETIYHGTRTGTDSEIF